VVRILAGVCIFLYVVALLLDLRGALSPRSFLGILSPTAQALNTLGMTGGFAWARGHYWTVLSAIYLHGMVEPDDFPAGSMRINVAPGVGELFVISALTQFGPSRVAFVEAIPDGPFDCFWDRPRPDEHLRRLQHLMLEHMPWEGELMRDCEPTDARASLSGAFTGTIRKPYAEVGDNTFVFGMGDVVVVNDPIAGQGANNAAHCAGIYTQAILERGDQPFDPEWMQATFETFWETRAQHSTGLTDALLNPLPDHV